MYNSRMTLKFLPWNHISISGVAVCPRKHRWSPIRPQCLRARGAGNSHENGDFFDFCHMIGKHPRTSHLVNFSGTSFFNLLRIGEARYLNRVARYSAVAIWVLGSTLGPQSKYSSRKNLRPSRRKSLANYQFTIIHQSICLHLLFLLATPWWCHHPLHALHGQTWRQNSIGPKRRRVHQMRSPRPVVDFPLARRAMAGAEPGIGGGSEL